MLPESRIKQKPQFKPDQAAYQASLASGNSGPTDKPYDEGLPGMMDMHGLIPPDEGSLGPNRSVISRSMLLSHLCPKHMWAEC